MRNPSRILVLVAILGLIVALGGLDISFLPGSSAAWWIAGFIAIWFFFMKDGGCCKTGQHRASEPNADTGAQ